MLRPRQRQLEPVLVWVSQTALDAILDEAEAKRPEETGGMLLGYESPGGRELAITDIVGPGPGAVHRRNSFEPDGDWQQKRLAEVYAASGRITTYLGDWHSHPNGAPAPSRDDIRTARRVARRKRSRTKHPLTLILGAGAEEDWLFTVYRYRRGKLRPTKAELL